MKLYKDGFVKIIDTPKVIERLKRAGWSEEQPAQIEEQEAPKRRGRPAKKEV